MKQIFVINPVLQTEMETVLNKQTPQKPKKQKEITDTFKKLLDEKTEELRLNPPPSG